MGKPKYVKVPKAKNTAVYTAPTYEAQSYQSKYGNQLDSALQGVTNFQYDPLKDASYQALAKIYAKRGETAAKNTMADASMLNGGLGTSYATSAAQQMRNDYNAELASLIPDLEERAYNRNVQTLAALGDAEDREYGRFRDTVGDTQWKYGTDLSNAQWEYSQDYQKYRDAVADQQWARNYNLDVYSLKKSRSGGGGGGRSGGGGRGGGGYYGGGSTGSGNPYKDKAVAKAKQKHKLAMDETKYSKKYSSGKSYLPKKRKHK